MIGLGLFVARAARVWNLLPLLAFGVADEIMWTEHCIRESAQDLYLGGSLKLDGFDPLSPEMDSWPELEAPPPAMQICGFKDGKVTLPAEYHT